MAIYHPIIVTEKFNKQTAVEIPNVTSSTTVSQTLGGPGIAHSHLNKSSIPASSFNGLAMTFCKITFANSLYHYRYQYVKSQSKGSNAQWWHYTGAYEVT